LKNDPKFNHPQGPQARLKEVKRDFLKISSFKMFEKS